MTAFLEINGTAYRLPQGDGSPDADKRIAVDTDGRLEAWIKDGTPVGRIPTIAPGDVAADLVVRPSLVVTHRAYVN
jgi:hypothetical protein